ncbi:PD-(D/E)XK nuclease family transposase [Pedobacter nutrimenti]|uniref:PD-(D/E)XK nuclease family transposase n=1 Tax=Pedobacter nutrimenti TaxID=1241337 RepID=UPI002931ED94|nr:PD-(D/E)XK nuclease family transposase [Pedobacter nutrimenti]
MNEHYGNNKEEGSAIFDLLCTGDKGEKFLIEVQNGKPGNFFLGAEPSRCGLGFPCQTNQNHSISFQFYSKPFRAYWVVGSCFLGIYIWFMGFVLRFKI